MRAEGAGPRAFASRMAGAVRWRSEAVVRGVIVAALRVSAAVRPAAPSRPPPEDARPRRVALFMRRLREGGGEESTLALARGLAARGIAVDLLVLRIGSASGAAPEGMRLIDFGGDGIVMACCRLLRYLGRARPDVLLTNNPGTGVPALVTKALVLRNLRVVFRYGNVISMQPVTHASRLLKHVLPFADAIVAVSEGAADEFERTFPRVAPLVRHVPSPVVPPDLAEVAAARVEHPWFGDGAAPIVLSAGRLAPEKDHAMLLRAFAEVVKLRNARLVVLGEGPERAGLTALARKLEISRCVDFPGDRRPPFPWMAKARVFVLSSGWEGLPRVLIEAMACGTPVVSTDCPYGPREILAGGRWGRLVPVGDSRSMAAAIVETLDAPPIPPDLLVRRANRWAAESSVVRHLKVLNDVVREPRPPCC